MGPPPDSETEWPGYPADRRMQVGELYLREADELHKYACSLPTFPGITPEDLVQTTFHDVILSWKKVSQLTADERRKWLRRILKNKYIDSWRKTRVIDLVPAVLDTEPDPVNTAEIAELSIALRSCWKEIKRMPPRRQIVAFLIWNEGWTTAGVADHLGMEQSTVRGHLKKARMQLRSSVGHLVPFIDDEEDRA